MNLKRMLFGILCVMVCMGLVIIGGCKKSVESQLIPTGALLDATDCKQFLANTSGSLDEFAPDQHDDCIEYQYNGTDTLTLMHINAGFNCDPGEITANIEINGNVITITEIESQQGADCLCLFDLDYEIINLPSGEYSVRIIEPYIHSNDQLLEITLHLLSETSGNYCLQRTYYPWGQ